MSVLEVNGVSIRYMTGDFKDIGLKEYIMRRLKGSYQVQEFWADRDVRFSLEKGDMLGIIGSNGAGKSTLLKVIAGIMEPTEGWVRHEGSIAALLELASGFDGDLTVRENAYLRGAMLGYTREFMDKTYEQIIDFAELKEFEDRPFKQLSSGMKSRLAFSIASLVKPDILILDEVLSVGDGAFQEKSAAKMREIISQGATTILVSHSLKQIRELCNKVLWLDHGCQMAFGETQEICDRYEAFLSAGGGLLSSDETQRQKEKTAETEPDDTGSPDRTGTSRHIRRFPLGRAAASLILAMFIAVLAVNLGQRSLEKKYVSYVEITALQDSGTVIFRGAYAGEKWVSPADHVTQDGGWLFGSEEKIYTAVDGQTLTFLLPMGKDRRLIFYAGPDGGIVSVKLDGQQFEFDLWNDTPRELGKAFQVPDPGMQNIQKQLLEIALVSFVCAFVLYFVFVVRPSDPAETEREIWLDALKVVSAFMVVLIHSAGNLYNDNFGVNEKLWMQGLLANAVPRFAVPCFLMITGAMSLTKHIDLHRVRKNVKRILIPLIFWSILHVTAANYQNVGGLFAGLVRIPFAHQDGPLWYAYQLIWLYLGMPFWTLLWEKLSQKKRWGFVAFSLLIPGILTQAEELMTLNTHEYLPFASIDPILCYVGLMFLGRLLYEMINAGAHGRIAAWGISCAVIGLLMMVGSSAYVSRIAQQSVHSFFSEVRLTGVVYSAGIFLCFGSVKGICSCFAGWMKKLVCSLSNVSLGVYMMHTLLIYKLLPSEVTFMGVSWNREANIWQLFVSVFVYYGIAVAICLFMSKFQYVKRLVI